MKRPKLLMVDTLSGANDYGVALAIALASKVELTFLTVENSRVPSDTPCRLLKVVPSYGGDGSRLAKLIQLLKYVCVLFIELWRHRDHSVHVQFFRFSLIDACIYLVCKPVLRRLVFSAHNALPHERKFWHLYFFRFWYRCVDKIHVLGKYTASQLRDIGVPSDRIVYVPHGNYALFQDRYRLDSPEIVRGRYGAKPTDTVFLFYGLIRDYKGVDRLVEAFCSLPPESNAYLVIAGGGDRTVVERAKMRLLGEGKQARFHIYYGFVPDPELANLVSACDVVVFPYRHVYQSGALLLGMTYGKATVASDIAGFRDYVCSGKDALLVDTSNVSILSSVLEELAKNSQMRVDLGREARERAFTEYDWGNIGARMVALYD